MRRAPRTSLIALLLAILALAAIGCGGSQVSADEVPGPPAALTVPSDRELGGGGADADADADSSEEDADSDTSTDDESGAGATDDGDAAEEGATPVPTATPEATAPPEDSATNDTPPPAGSEAEQFEDFCAQNAGAC